MKRRSIKRINTQIIIQNPQEPQSTIDYGFIKKDFKEAVGYEFAEYMSILILVIIEEFKLTNDQTFKTIFFRSINTTDKIMNRIFMISETDENSLPRILKRRIMFATWYAFLDIFGLKRTKNITIKTTNIIRKSIAGAFGIVFVSEILHIIFKTPSIIDGIQKFREKWSLGD
jgi:hypothetical protein